MTITVKAEIESYGAGHLVLTGGLGPLPLKCRLAHFRHNLIRPGLYPHQTIRAQEMQYITDNCQGTVQCCRLVPSQTLPCAK